MISLRQYILREQKSSGVAVLPKLPWNGNPAIGWWLDSKTVTFYHGTHKRNLEFISKNGLIAPTTGSTAGLVSLALDPRTALGYASMSGAGGETLFRGTGTKPVHTPVSDRIVFVIKIPQSDFLSKMAPQRGNVKDYTDRLTNRDRYDNFGGSDNEYYMMTEIRYPNVVPAKYIKGYMQKTS